MLVVFDEPSNEMCVLIYFYIKLEPFQIYIILCITCSSTVLEYKTFQGAVHLWYFVMRLFKIINNEVRIQEKAEYVAMVTLLCSRLYYNG